MLAASSYVPAKNNSDIQDGNILHGGGSDRGDSVAALWPAIELIRDPYTQASQGVILTWITLWDCQTAFRAGGYSRETFKVG